MEWVKIKENYSVNNIGQVKNDKTGRILKQSTRKDGYCQVMMGRKTVPQYIHRLVAEAFLENPQNLPQVDHINGNRSDNRAENLRWVSVSDNCLGYGYSNRITNRKKKVIAIKGDEIIKFNSRDDAARYFKCDKSCIVYGKEYTKGNKKGYTLYLEKDIV